MSIRYAPLMALLASGLPATVFAQDHAHHNDHQHAPETEAKWHVMTHGVVTVVADHQSGPRGGDKTFLQGMVMTSAHRKLTDKADLTLEAMLSPDPFMGKDGYPLLLQTGETADGVHHLVDRQHPHDLFMGLTAKVGYRFDGGTRASIQVGYPGEFAFGPTAFMHRKSGENFPTAPITHHWLDSGHITMGVVTAAVEKGSLKLEVSQFTGREPDEKRFDLDPVRLDSTSVRATWQVTPNLRAQVSRARQVSPEQLHPDENVIKTSAGVEFAVGGWNSTLTFARKEDEDGHHKPADAVLFENSLAFSGPWTGLLRYERVYNSELGPDPVWVAKTEVGVMRTIALNDSTSLGVGVVQQFNSIPDRLEASYGGDPQGTVGFVTLKFSSMPGM
ncbi:hypothetical protein ABAC460_04625 [Asticcacaulis sp. AC460]|uniref:hypothetical protein n=1 Tax=Asticcacaulis sp. AC460 TaxID=1282360 RepID=UPI0003C3F303|nr:hypothetical protein [Asticcacaulis sp. AC460]ESQ92177.1 hypothetical protein ABAC460_04625 [Asticcacaulis sp. AC460]